MRRLLPPSQPKEKLQPRQTRGAQGFALFFSPPVESDRSAVSRQLAPRSRILRVLLPARQSVAPSSLPADCGHCLSSYNVFDVNADWRFLLRQRPLGWIDFAHERHYNTDLAGSVTLSAGAGSYAALKGTYASAPFCVATDSTAAAATRRHFTATTLTLAGDHGRPPLRLRRHEVASRPDNARPLGRHCSHLPEISAGVRFAACRSSLQKAFYDCPRSHQAQHALLGAEHRRPSDRRRSAEDCLCGSAQ